MLDMEIHQHFQLVFITKYDHCIGSLLIDVHIGFHVILHIKVYSALYVDIAIVLPIDIPIVLHINIPIVLHIEISIFPILTFIYGIPSGMHCL